MSGQDITWEDFVPERHTMTGMLKELAAERAATKPANARAAYKPLSKSARTKSKQQTTAALAKVLGMDPAQLQTTIEEAKIAAAKTTKRVAKKTAIGATKEMGRMAFPALVASMVLADPNGVAQHALNQIKSNTAIRFAEQVTGSEFLPTHYYTAAEIGGSVTTPVAVQTSNILFDAFNLNKQLPTDFNVQAFHDTTRSWASTLTGTSGTALDFSKMGQVFNIDALDNATPQTINALTSVLKEAQTRLPTYQDHITITSDKEALALLSALDTNKNKRQIAQIITLPAGMSNDGTTILSPLLKKVAAGKSITADLNKYTADIASAEKAYQQTLKSFENAKASGALADMKLASAITGISVTEMLTVCHRETHCDPKQYFKGVTKDRTASGIDQMVDGTAILFKHKFGKQIVAQIDAYIQKMDQNNNSLLQADQLNKLEYVKYLLTSKNVTAQQIKENALAEMMLIHTGNHADLREINKSLSRDLKTTPEKIDSLLPVESQAALVNNWGLSRAKRIMSAYIQGQQGRASAANRSITSLLGAKGAELLDKNNMTNTSVTKFIHLHFKNTANGFARNLAADDQSLEKTGKADKGIKYLAEATTAEFTTPANYNFTQASTTVTASKKTIEAKATNQDAALVAEVTAPKKAKRMTVAKTKADANAKLAAVFANANKLNKHTTQTNAAEANSTVTETVQVTTVATNRADYNFTQATAAITTRAPAISDRVSAEQAIEINTQLDAVLKRAPSKTPATAFNPG